MRVLDHHHHSSIFFSDWCECSTTTITPRIFFFRLVRALDHQHHSSIFFQTGASARPPPSLLEFFSDWCGFLLTLEWQVAPRRASPMSFLNCLSTPPASAWADYRCAAVASRCRSNSSCVASALSSRWEEIAKALASHMPRCAPQGSTVGSCATPQPTIVRGRKRPRRLRAGPERLDVLLRCMTCSGLCDLHFSLYRQQKQSHAL